MQAIIADTETTGLKEPVPVEVAYIDVSKLFKVPEFKVGKGLKDAVA